MNPSKQIGTLLSAMLFSALVFQPATSQGEVKLPNIFADHMVLQQQMPIQVWGWADPAEAVTVTLGSNTVAAKFGTQGNDKTRWTAVLPAMTASKTPAVLTVKGSNTVEIKDVLIGEVWLCSGQSNMEWTVGSSTNAKQEIADANYSLIRQIKVPRVPSTTPLDNFDSSWQICSPETAAAFTACGYFMARKLHTELDVPIGLVNSSWGGTRVEPWTPPNGFQQVEALQDIYQSVIGRTPGTDAYTQTLSGHIGSLEKWLAEAKANLHGPNSVTASPAFPDSLTPFKSHQDPTMLYNGMIHSIVGFPIRGAIWYQGESNHGEGMLYFEKKKALIGGWRELWKQGDFPFYYVQIAPYQYGSEDPAVLATFWEAQAAVQQIPNTGMVVINDIATLNDIHPPNKQDVGLRLANLALKNDYGKSDVVANSPEFDSLEVQKGQLLVTMKDVGGGLKTRDGKSPSHFEIIGPGSGGFQPAKATISADGKSIVLTADGVDEPVACRFAWHKLAEPNLMGGTGLPVGAFRAGELPSFLKSLPIGSEYKLVYDLDLSTLSKDIKYDIDNSGDVSAFDRIAYLLDLTLNDGQQRQIFVSMNAFTDDIKKVGIPTVASGAKFQQMVESMDVYSNAKDITTGSGIATGNIEFWPSNYAPENSGSVPGAANVFDFGDAPGAPNEGYGCMQVHNHGAKQTVFAVNNWKSGNGADIGIGNSPGETKDWTFTANAGTYAAKRLQVLVRTK
ncbi:MAG: sialate O-acetylesterase [Fuerstiella sp.]